ncbi:uncharacterized protein LOC118797764 [Colossoma macropomum]|uniref:uncharacterized protein LOC118797764 n=1 Tax=Colossoma macropomum TaxID=42526 RepID=UPI001865313F|nr:uncharacterized protein LOC118797764 [Colossoma macropomum]
MKIFLIFILYLISGPVGCFDVIGYPGGSVVIYCSHSQYGEFDKYFCRKPLNECAFIKSNQTQNTWSHKERLSLYDSSGGLIVIYRNLSLQDAGSYQCGETGVWNHTVNLKVNTDPCYLGSKTVSGYLGETVTISCSYANEFKTDIKMFYKVDGQDFTEVIRTIQSQNDRFLISDDRSSKVVSVTISDVREDDGGVYFCGVGSVGESISYNSLYREILLQVTAKGMSSKSKQTLPAGWGSTLKPTAETYRTTSAAPSTVTSEEHFSSSLIITVCVCVALLLIGGSTLIFYKLRCTKTQDSDKDTYSTNHPPKDESLTYATVIFQKNPDSASNTPVTYSKEERVRSKARESEQDKRATLES